MRRPVKNKHAVAPDPTYGSLQVAKLINYVMESGKKDTARSIVEAAFKELEKEGDPIAVLEEAIKNVEPHVEVRSRRVGGANYQVPREVRPERRLALAYRWIIGAARGKKGVPMYKSLAEELQKAARGEGDAVAKRDNVRKMAEANKAFAHFAW